MRKAFLILMLLLLVFVPAVSVTHAQSAEGGDTLAVYFPESTLVYASIRTDDAMFAELDGLLNQLTNNLPGMLPSGINTKDLLDLFLIEQTGLSSQILLDWAGGSVAVGLPSIDAAMLSGDIEDTLELILAAEVADRTAAEDFIRMIATGQDVVETGGKEYTLFTDDAGMMVLIADDVLLLGVNTDVKALLNQETNLAESESYQTTILALPSKSYQVIAYIDAASLTEMSLEIAEMAMAELGPDQQAGMAELLAISGGQSTAVGQIGLGMDIIDSRSLILDLATTIPDDAPTSAMMIDQTPVNMDFAGNIPGGAELVLQTNNMGGQMLATFAALDEITPVYQELLQSVLNVEGSSEIIEELLREMDLDNMVNAEDALAFLQGVDISTIKLGGIVENALTQLLAGFTGLNLRNDVLEVLDGDAAMWVDVIPLEGGTLPITLDLAFASGASDSAGTAHMVEKIAEAAELYGVPHEFGAVGSGQAVALGEVIQGLLAETGAIPPEILNMPELDLLVGANDDLFVMGMRPGVSFALNGDTAGSLLNNPAYKYASEILFLEDTVGVAFINARGLMDLLPVLSPFMGSSDLEQISILGALVESMSITSSVSDNSQIVRLSITAPIEPYVPELSGGSSGDTITSNVMTGGPYDGLFQSVSDNGIAQVGSDDTAVLVEMYESFSCPHCANFHDAYMADLIALAQTGDVTLQYIPLLTGNVPGGDIATAAAYCAGEQGQFWNFHDLLFEWHREYGETAFDTGRMEEGLVSLNVNLETFFTCFSEGRGFAFLDAGIQKASAAGVTGTPTVHVNGVQVNPADMIAAINEALGK